MNKKLLCVILALIFLSLSLSSCYDIINNVNNSSEVSAEETFHETVSGSLTVRFLDVGQGDSMLIAFPDGKYMLIDAGVYTNKEAVLGSLEKYGVSEIEYAVFTHFHADHIGAAADVINGYRVNNVIMPDATATSATFDNMLSALEVHKETNVIKGEAGYKFNVGGASFEILSPFDTEDTDANETSIVLLMKYGEVKMLFMGDAAKSNEEEIINSYGSSYIKANLIKIGHHGSSSSSSEVFLKAVSSEYAVISCGEGNSYGHPHQETLDTLAFLGIAYFRTDTQGEITAVTDGNNLSVSAESGD